MVAREECLRLLVEFVHSGDIAQAAMAAGTILAYLTTLDGKDAQLTALDDLRMTIASRCEEAVGTAEERHVAVEDALEQALITLKGTPVPTRANDGL